MNARWWPLALVIWLATIAAAALAVAFHASRPGGAAPLVARWPAGTGVAAAAGGLTLLCFVHPRCPCTPATVRELERILSRLAASGAPVPEVRVAFLATRGDDVTASPSWSPAARLPRVVLLRDEGGREAARFGAVTSGTVLVYDASGALRFHGGVTASRGHEGGSDGADALESVLRAPSPSSIPTAPVFGCGLRGPSRR